ncbi:MAG: AraC family transcriptional regulator [Verrucomicrobiota bacterium]
MLTSDLPVDKWDRLRRELVWIRRAAIEKSNQSLSYQPQGRIAAWRLIHGRATFRLSSGLSRVKAGQWIFPGTGTGDRTFSDDAEIISLRFHLEWPGGENLFDHRKPIIVGGRETHDLDRAGFALVDFVQANLTPSGFHLPWAATNLDRYLTLQTHFERWLRAYVELMTGSGQAPGPAPHGDPRIQEAVRLMESRLRAGEVLTENDAARGVGLSLSQFKRLFARDLKKTPKAWLDDLRYELACDRLGETGQTVKEIGYELGFRSPNHFSAWFSQRRGCPPGQAGRGGRG